MRLECTTVPTKPGSLSAASAALETPRFMAVVWGAGGQGDGPTTIVQLDGNGECRRR